jgi:hypothetical protein
MAPIRKLPVPIALLLAALVLAGCGERERPQSELAGAAAGDPADRLAELLPRGAQPGALTLEERQEVEELILAVLPETTGELAGYRWRVTYIDLPEADFIAADLLTGGEDLAPRAAWVHVFWRSSAAQPRAEYPGRLGPYPARGLPGHHLFVRAGRVEVRAVAEAEELRRPGALEALVEGFDLARLARY